MTSQEEIIGGGEPTQEESELVAWAQEAIRKSLSTVQESLRLMVTLTTGLLAGSAALFSSLPLLLGLKALTCLFLIISLGFALWGSFPREARVDVRCPEDIKAERQNGIVVKTYCLQGSSICLLCAFVVLIGGMILSNS